MATETFGYTGGVQTYTVPENVELVEVRCWGAGSGEDTGSNGAAGGYAEGWLDVTPGETLHVYVGGSGTNGGWPNGGSGDGQGGDGAGSTEVRRSTSVSDRVIVAGGAGGARALVEDFNYPPGVGGGNEGEDAGNSSYGVSTGGTQTSGGVGDGGGADGSGPNGGNAGAATDAGGGGGGYHGGAGGGEASDGGDTATWGGA
ncbi:hypothetical protein DJ68_04230, partial [Halorubrum sp. C3]